MKKNYVAGNTITLRLRKDDLDLMEWAGKQSELGDSLRFLIEQEIQRKGFIDLSREIKHKRDILPKSTDIEKPLLNLLYKNESVRTRDAYEELAKVFELSTEDQSIVVRDGEEPQWFNNCRWSRQNLKNKGYIKNDSPWGIWEISEEGKEHYLKMNKG